MRGEVKKSDMVVISVSAKQSDVGRDLYFFVLTKICVRRAEVKGIDTRSDQSEARTRRGEQNWGQQSKTIQYPAPYHCHNDNHPNKTDSSL